MKIGMIQNHITENIIQNINEARQLILSTKADLIVLPEMWNCPYENEIMKDSIQYFNQSYEMMKECAKQTSSFIVGGTIAHPKGDKIYNTCFVFDPKGNEVAQYSKTHLFELYAYNTTYTERDVFDAGNTFSTFHVGDIKVGILVCYDIRFPEVSRLLAQEGCQILCCPAAFNYTTGTLHWKILNTVRAMENEVFFVGVGPAHYTYKNFTPYSHSLLIGPDGIEIASLQEEIESKVVEIDIDTLKQIREKLPYWKVRRNDLYILKEIDK